VSLDVVLADELLREFRYVSLARGRRSDEDPAALAGWRDLRC